VRQFVLSASEQTLLNKSIEHYNLKGVFCDALGVDNLNAVGKVERGWDLLKKHNLRAKETLLIGDTEYDWEVAQGLGCRVVLISHGHINHQRLQKTGCLVLKNIDALSKYLVINL
jgi:phosphoglycolate phosphatase